MKPTMLMLKDLPENDKGTAGSLPPGYVTDRMPLSSRSGDSAVWLQRLDDFEKKRNSGEPCQRQSRVESTSLSLSLSDGAESASVFFRRRSGRLARLGVRGKQVPDLKGSKNFWRDV
jgi:hypothetical protein